MSTLRQVSHDAVDAYVQTFKKKLEQQLTGPGAQEKILHALQTDKLEAHLDGIQNDIDDEVTLELGAIFDLYDKDHNGTLDEKEEKALFEAFLRKDLKNSKKMILEKVEGPMLDQMVDQIERKHNLSFTPCYPLLPLVTPCYPLLPLVTPCYPSFFY
jgi:hypothetical protein